VLIIVTTLALVVYCIFFINFSYCYQCMFTVHYVYTNRGKIIHIHSVYKISEIQKDTRNKFSCYFFKV